MSEGHDYLRTRITIRDFEFSVPEGSEEVAACIRQLAEVVASIDLKHAARAMAIAQILQEAGLTTYGNFAKLSKEIEERLIKQASEGAPDASG